MKLATFLAAGLLPVTVLAQGTVVARVGDRPILRAVLEENVQRQLNSQYFHAKLTGPALNELRKRELVRLVERELCLWAGLDRGWKLPAKEAAAEAKRMEEQLGKAEYERSLAARGWTAWLGTSDARHVRVRLAHQEAGFSVTAFSDWQRLSQGRLLQATPVTGTTRTHTMQIASGPLQLVGNVGSSRWHDGTDVALDFASVAGSVRFGRNVSFRGSHRIEKRHVPFPPQLDFTRSEAALDFSLGAFVASIVGETVLEQLEGGGQRQFKSVRWTISRRFGGLLPFVSAPARRGVIR